MAGIPFKHILLVGFVLLCISSTTPKARSLPNARETEKGHDDQMLTATKGEAPNVDELVAMDYSPASRKPPIHN
ncbi:hypothetical protein CRYUN_Cryun26dG0115400 [Craigia yunnanensis]